MLMADTMAIFFVILGLLLAFPGLWLLCRGLWPQTVIKSASICRTGLVKPFLAGLPFTAVVIFAAVVLTNFGAAGKITATGLICAFLVLANIGVAGLVTCIGERLPSSADVSQAWRATLRGGVVLELVYLLPILGWFVILPISITIGCGAGVMALFKNFLKPSLKSSVKSAGASLPEELQPVTPHGFGVTGSLGGER